MSTNEELLYSCDFVINYYGHDDLSAHRVATALRERLIKERDGWIKVKERLPDTGTSVLAFCEDGIFQVQASHLRQLEENARNELQASYYTDWQPLPAAPKE